ncbi:MAG: hypothetical protein Q4B40_04860 [Clostridia bacterium]|nr:hypothetical protein [Clostridia bacterium]
MKFTKEKLKQYAKTTVQFLLNPRLLLCLGLAWIITNGWAYVCATLGVMLKINWLATVSAAYLAALWVPFTPEKIITVIIAIFLLKLLFPNDKKTLKKLYNMKEKIKNQTKKINLKIKEKKHNKKDLQDK